MYKKTKHHEEDTMIFFLVFSYYYNQDQYFKINQELLATYFGVCRASINRHIGKMKQLGVLTVADKRYFNKQKGKNWKNNCYTLDQKSLNDYLIKNFNTDVLGEIASYADQFYDFLKFRERYYASPEDIKKIEDRERREAQLIKKYTKKYPDYLERLEKLNADDERKIKMCYLKEGKKRLTSDLCNTINPEKHLDYKTARENLLKKQYGDIKLIELDTNASIYRLTYNLTHDKLLSHDVDIYELIYNECGWDKPWNKKVRELFKDLLMPIYMRESSISYRDQEYKNKKAFQSFYKKSDKEFVEYYKQVEEFFDAELIDILEIVKQAMHRVLNTQTFYQAEIFIHESNLHIIILEKMKERGIIASNVYDGFYVPKGTLTRNEYNQIYDEATLEMKKTLKTVKKVGKLSEE